MTLLGLKAHSKVSKQGSPHTQLVQSDYSSSRGWAWIKLLCQMHLPWFLYKLQFYIQSYFFMSQTLEHLLCSAGN